MTTALMGLDIGNTNIKCIIINPHGQVLSLSKRPSRFYSRGDGGRYLAGEKLMDTVAGLCRETLEKTTGCEIKGLAVAGMGCAGIYLDEQNRQVVLPALEDDSDPMPALSEAEYINICGYPKYYSSAGMNLARQLDAGFEKASRVACLLSISDYVNYALTGVKKRDLSTAGAMTLRDKRHCTDWQAFMDVHGICAAIVPEICQSGDYIGGVNAASAAAAGLPEGLPVFAGGHDYLCAAFAAGCVNEGDIINVLGTFEMLATFYNKPRNDFYNPALLSFIDHHVYPGRYTITTENPCIRFIKDKYPALDSERYPLERRFMALDKQPVSPGDWLPGTLAHALLELNTQSAKMVGYLQALAGDKVLKRIKVVGGGSNSRFWLQNKANVTGLTINVPRIPEATAAGAALLAGYGCGIYSSYDEASRVFGEVSAENYEPDEKWR